MEADRHGRLGRASTDNAVWMGFLDIGVRPWVTKETIDSWLQRRRYARIDGLKGVSTDCVIWF